METAYSKTDLIATPEAMYMSAVAAIYLTQQDKLTEILSNDAVGVRKECGDETATSTFNGKFFQELTSVIRSTNGPHCGRHSDLQREETRQCQQYPY